MPIILALAALEPETLPAPLAGAVALAAGPDGLFAVRLAADELRLQPLAQPMSSLSTVAVAAERVIVGGSPYGAASLPLAQLVAHGAPSPAWQAGWMDYTQQPVVLLAASPDADDARVLLAASWGDGVLRSTSGGRSWELCNTGLSDTRVLALAWAPLPPPTAWPARAIAFAGSESGLFRSPAGGRAWRRCAGIEGAVHAVAAAADFHTSGLVLAASGSNDEGRPTRLWRSSDGGRSFAQTPAPMAQCEALAAHAGWLLASDGPAIWRAGDGAAWAPLQTLAPEAGSALCLLPLEQALLVGTATGVTAIAWNATPIAAI